MEEQHEVSPDWVCIALRMTPGQRELLRRASSASFRHERFLVDTPFEQVGDRHEPTRYAVRIANRAARQVRGCFIFPAMARTGALSHIPCPSAIREPDF